MNDTFKKLMETTTPNPELAEKYKETKANYVWMNMLIKYDPITGEGVVVRSFSRPAKESNIKGIVKPKKKKEKSVFDKKIESTETSDLF